MIEQPPTPIVRLVEVEPHEHHDWLARMEAAFAAGVSDAGLQPGDQPIPHADEMAEMMQGPGEVLHLVVDDHVVGGAAVTDVTDGRRGLELFFVDAGHHGGGVGGRAWDAIEARYPDTRVWETDTPYFEQRNIHFYVNRCGFHIVEFFHPGHLPPEGSGADHPGPDRSFRFEKVMSTTPA